MLDKLKFYKNRGHRCAETSLKSVLSMYCSDRLFSFKEIGQLLKRKEGKSIYLIQIANFLLDYNISFDYYSNKGIESLLNNSESYLIDSIKESYGDSYEKVLEITDLPILKECAKKIVNLKSDFCRYRYKRCELSFDIVERHIRERGNCAICLVNQDILVGRENKFNGHYLLLTNSGSDWVQYLDSGPIGAGPNIINWKNRFLSAWNKMCFFDEDTILISKI